MKILCKDSCYLARRDLELLLYYDKNITSDIYNLIVECLDTNKSKYVKVTNKKLLDYILNSKLILNFNELYDCSLSELENKLNKIKSDYDNSYFEFSENYKSLIQFYREKSYNRYLIHQYNQIIEYKKKVSKCNFPNIPNLSINPIIGDEMIAYKSLDYDYIIVKQINGRDIDDVPVEFCKTAFNILMRDEIEELGYDFDEKIQVVDSKTIIVSALKKEQTKKDSLKLTLSPKHKKSKHN